MSDSTTYETLGPVETELSATISSAAQIIEEARKGWMIILVDHEDRENEGDLVTRADVCDAAAVNFMATYGRGLIGLPMEARWIEELGLPMMALNNSSRHETAFTVSIEAREGVITGILAGDRALTVETAIDPSNGPAEIATPGHVFPLRACNGGVLVRAGHTEAAVDIARIAGRNPSGVIGEIMSEDGTMVRLPEFFEIAKKHGMKVGTIFDLIADPRRHDNLVRETTREAVTSQFGGNWEMRTFTDQTHDIEHVTLIKGDISSGAPVLVHTHALTEAQDVLGLGPKPADQLPRAIQILAEEGRGVACRFREPRKTLHAYEEEGPRTVRQIGLAFDRAFAQMGHFESGRWV